MKTSEGASNTSDSSWRITTTTLVFIARDWKVISEDNHEIRTDFHVSLKDHVRAEVIKWAWDEDGSLVEIHSHGPMLDAKFSPSDLMGFQEWIPHVWWRLQGRPYAAIVTQVTPPTRWLGSKRQIVPSR